MHTCCYVLYLLKIFVFDGKCYTLKSIHLDVNKLSPSVPVLGCQEVVEPGEEAGYDLLDSRLTQTPIETRLILKLSSAAWRGGWL